MVTLSVVPEGLA
ncbi:PE family protein PE29, partial [Mycobacterium tuberculosis KT-0001]